MTPTVAILFTGGTISMRIDARSGSAVPAMRGGDILAHVPQLADEADIELEDVAWVTKSQDGKMKLHQGANLTGAGAAVVERPLVRPTGCRIAVPLLAPAAAVRRQSGAGPDHER